VKAASRRTSRAGTRWVAALSVVSSTKRGGIAWVSAASVAMRAAEMSGLGDTRSNGRQSQLGNENTGIPGAKKASASRIACIRLSSRATWTTRPPERSASSRSRRASKPSGAPPTVMRVVGDMACT
jgi:hypothetical protein